MQLSLWRSGTVSAGSAGAVVEISRPDGAQFRLRLEGAAVDALGQADPYSGCVFVFRSRTGGSLRLLMFDGTGYWLCHKRLSQGRFRH
jgi:hypothetical protein